MDKAKKEQNLQVPDRREDENKEVNVVRELKNKELNKLIKMRKRKFWEELSGDRPTYIKLF